MTQFDYAKAQATAKGLLARMGALQVLQKMDTGTYNTGTGKVTQAAATSYNISGALLDFRAGQVYGPAGLIQMGDKRLLLAAGVAAPQIGDSVAASDGKTYQVAGVADTNPAGTPVLYDVHLRI